MRARWRSREATQAVFVHPYDDPDVIAGQGTIGMEILRQQQGPIDAIFVAVGGGGLIAGIAAYVKRVRPEIRIIGVEPVDSAAMTQSLAGRAAGDARPCRAVRRRRGGQAGRARKLSASAARWSTRWCAWTRDAICAAIKDAFEDTRSILEPAGALPIAGVKAYCERHRSRGKTYVAIACGANMNFDRLRFVAERAELGEEREAILAVTIPERPGSFREFCALLGKRSITEFNYRYADARSAHLFVGVEVANRQRDRGAVARDAPAAHRRPTTCPTTKWPSCTCAIWSAATRRRPSTRSCFASSSRSARAR